MVSAVASQALFFQRNRAPRAANQLTINHRCASINRIGQVIRANGFDDPVIRARFVARNA
jgi:hypothetical protein